MIKISDCVYKPGVFKDWKLQIDCEYFFNDLFFTAKFYFLLIFSAVF